MDLEIPPTYGKTNGRLAWPHHDGLPVVGERRRCAARHRMPWTAPLPYAATRLVTVSHESDGDRLVPADPVSAAEQRRSAWTRPLIAKAVLGDLGCAIAVMAAALISYDGTFTRVELLGVLLMAAVWPALLLLGGGYDARRLGDGPEELQTIVRCGLWLLAGLSVLALTAREDPPRRYVLIAVPLLTILTALQRQVQRKLLHRARARGHALQRTLVVGETATVERFSADLNARQYHGYNVVGACLTSGSEPPRQRGLPTWGTFSEVPQVVVEQQIDVVLVVGAQVVGEPLRRLSWALERTGAELVVAPGLVEVTGSRTRMRPAAGLSLIQVERPRYLEGPILKSVVDRTLGTLCLLMALPVLVTAALAVRLTTPGPVFYRQERVGQNGRSFRMIKLRTMHRDADQQRESLRSLSDRDGLMFKMREDPRVTPVGRWLRRFSLDELPQLWNVVRGDMALVGPRPPLPEEHAAYQDAVHRRMHVKPGLTGLWQVSGRADLSWEESIRLDLRYVDNWSMALDAQILWKTFRAVCRGKGAY